MNENVTDALVIGSGPAGLMAAEELAKAGRKVLIVEAKPSVGRKFLMAGKSGLNLTKDEDMALLEPVFDEARWVIRPMLRAFNPVAVQDWARGLGQEIFTGTSGRVFPKAMKASPLLRAWMGRLADLGVEIKTRWRWTGLDDDGFAFATPDGTQVLRPAVTVLALGGASWARLGSDGAWSTLLAKRGVELSPFLPANAGLAVEWSPHMAALFGTPVKGVALNAGTSVRGEFVISKRGLEGGGIYAVSKAVRNGAPLTIDLMPDWEHGKVAERLARPRGKDTVVNHIRKALKLDPARMALLMEFGRPLPSGEMLVQLIKKLPVKHAGLRPIDEAISTAGGVPFAAMDEGLMLKAMPGVFCAGEMLDWEAPTGGYLITACLATGHWAGQHAAAYRAE
jgi:hypothetical protein